MKYTDKHEKFIYCLEGNWNKHPKSNQSIKPILDLLYTFSKVKYIYHKCPTKEEFIRKLETFTQKRYSNYTVLYIAYHGRKNRIYFGNEYITLKEIANVLEGKLNGKIVQHSTLQKRISSNLSTVQAVFLFRVIKKMWNTLIVPLLN